MLLFTIDAISGQYIVIMDSKAVWGMETLIIYMYEKYLSQIRKNMTGNIFEQPHLFQNFEKFPNGTNRLDATNI